MGYSVCSKIEDGQPLTTASSFIQFCYKLLVVKVMYLSPPSGEEIDITVDIPLKVALISTLVAILVLGIYPTWLLELTRSVAQVLLIQ